MSLRNAHVEAITPQRMEAGAIRDAYQETYFPVRVPHQFGEESDDDEYQRTAN